MRHSLLILLLLFVAVAVHSVAAQHLPMFMPPQEQPATRTAFDLHPQKSIAHYIRRTWQMEQGLPQNSAQALCQTRDGYLWIGTEEGLVRFDGVQFTVFDVNNTPALGANTIQALCEDRSGTLWIGTNGGGVCAYKNGVFTSFTSRDGLSNDFVSSIVEDRTASGKTVLWIGTLGGGLNRMEISGNVPVFTAYTTANGLTHNIIFSLIQSHTGALWIGTNGGGVNRYEQGVFSALTTANGLSRNQVRSLCEDRNGALWIGTFGGGLNCYADGKMTVFTTKNGLRHDIVWSLCEDRSGALWIGTFGGGLNRLYNGVMSAYTENNGLSSNLVRSICQDREGALWVGTVGGLNNFADGKFTTYTTKDGLTHDVVRAVLGERSGSGIWVGTFGGGVNVLTNGNVPSVKSIITTRAGGLPTDIIYALLEERNVSGKAGALWIGTNGGGLCRVQGGKTTTFTTKNGLTNDVVFTLLQDKKGVLWIGTVGGGVNRYENGVFTHLTTQEGLPSDNVRALLEDRNGAVWIGTVGGGIAQYFEGKITVYSTNEGLSNNTIRSFHEDETGVLWVGTVGGGLCRFKDGVFRAITTKHGLFNDVIHSIVDDGCGYFWMSCNKGIFRVLKQDLNAFADGTKKSVTSDVFGTLDGMFNAECNSGSPAGIRDARGNLWFATMTGVVTVNPRSNGLGGGMVQPTVIIEAVQADSLRRDVSAPLTVSANAENIEFHYTATSLTAPERTRFRYMLEGFDKEWVDAGKRRVAYYTHLPKGRMYRFCVQASNGQGRWGSGMASVELTLEAAFWETWWFYALCGISLGGLIILAVRMRIGQFQRRAKRLESLVYERTTELRQSNEEIQHHLEVLDKQSQEIESANTVLREKNLQLEALHQEKDEFLGIAAHDLRNPLASIKIAAELIRKARSVPSGEGIVTEQLHKIEILAERMTGIVSNFLDLNALESGAMQVGRQEVALRPLVQEIIEEYRTKAAIKHITVIADFPEAAPLLVLGDKQLIEEVLENLLSNAVKFSPHGKRVVVRIWDSGNGKRAENVVESSSPVPYPSSVLRIEIQDEGAGISAEDMPLLFKKFTKLATRPTGGEHSTGLGLSIVKKMVEAMNGRVWCESELGKGATFIVELPHGSDIL
ncbi:MAG: ATP-binding protein [Candidatus Kapabacteria bacterium]|nr:ATP-binding protein [Candidatus Kapabacteria bacterium]